MFEELNLELLEGDMERSIKQLKSNKSGGPDKIINEFFIHGNQILQSRICNLFNKILFQVIFLRNGLKPRLHYTTS